jgi:flagellar basal body-associated protein FliL
MFLLILVVLLHVCVDFGGSNMQKNHQNQHKHTKEPPKSTKTYKRTTKINKNMQKNHQGLLYVSVDFGGSFVCLC